MKNKNSYGTFRPITVFQLQAAGLRTDFPPLRGVDSIPRKFASGDHELDRPRRRGLQSSSGPALASVGDVGGRGWRWQDPAGGGSRDAVSRRICRRCLVFESAAVADPAAVPDAVAAVLGITQQPGKSVSESVASALEGRSRLLVFDNCEHVVDSVADLVAAILAASATVKVLATSRRGNRCRRRAFVAGAFTGR